MNELNNKMDNLLEQLVDLCGGNIWYDYQAGEKNPALEEARTQITEQVRLGREKWLDGQIKHLLDDIYPEDLFTPPTDEDYKKANDFDANLHTRLHCDGIRHGLQVLRREVRGLSARDDLPPTTDTTLLEGNAVMNTSKEK